jgi:hypothetical protein
MALAYAPAPSTSQPAGLTGSPAGQPLPGTIVEVSYRADGTRLVRAQHDPALNDRDFPGSRSIGSYGRK